MLVLDLSFSDNCPSERRTISFSLFLLTGHHEGFISQWLQYVLLYAPAFQCKKTEKTRSVIVLLNHTEQQQKKGDLWSCLTILPYLLPAIWYSPLIAYNGNFIICKIKCILNFVHKATKMMLLCTRACASLAQRLERGIKTAWISSPHYIIRQIHWEQILVLVNNILVTREKIKHATMLMSQTRVSAVLI